MIAKAGDREAMTAAKEWLALVDAGEYNQSWLAANKTLKEQSDKCTLTFWYIHQKGNSD
jgi:hypothetical protein